jgi:hypothetical protein
VTGFTNFDQFSSSIPRGLPVCRADFEHNNAENQQFEAGFPEHPNGMASRAKSIVSAIPHKIRVFPFYFVWLGHWLLSGMSIANKSCIEVKIQSCCWSERHAFATGFISQYRIL